jgi:signal transduction histidine kinase
VTVRLKLALLYGLLFLIAGAALVGISYQLVSRKLPADQLQSASSQDVALRAAKLSTEPDLSAPDRNALRKLANAAPSDALAQVKAGNLPLSPRAIQELTAALAVNVRDDALHELLVQSLLALGVVAVASVVLGWFVAGRVLRPLRQITATADRLSASNLDERIDLRGPDDELTRLGRTFDAMLDRLAASFEGQRRFVANASHELRTPLTIMATELDVTLTRPDASVDDLRRMGTTVRSAIDRSDRLVTSLLALARVEEGLEVVQTVDLTAVAANALSRAEGDAMGAELHVTTELEPCTVTGDPGLLDRLVDNLVENAIRHNIEGGWIHVTTRARDGAALIEVASSGRVVPPDATDGLFVPFRRFDDRTGSQRSMGLGLSIVQSIANAHHAGAAAEPVVGGGLRVTVRFPPQ